MRIPIGILIAFVITLTLPQIGQAQPWSQTFPGTNYASFLPIVSPTADDGYIVGGTMDIDVGAGHYNVWIAKLSATGMPTAWSPRNYGAADTASAHSLQEIVNQSGNPEGYMMVSNRRGDTINGSDVWMLKLTADGDVAEDCNYHLGPWDSPYAARQVFDPAGNPDGYIVVGYLDQPFDITGDAFVLKVNQDGTVAWSKSYGASGDDVLTSVELSRDASGAVDGYIVAGHTTSFGAGSYDYWVVKLNLDGTPVWQKTYGAPGDEPQYYSIPTVIKPSFDTAGNPDGYVLMGETRSFSAPYFNTWILRLNLDGTIAWQKIYGSLFTAIQQTTDQGFIIAGSLFEVIGDTDAWIAKLNANGSITWQKTYGGDSGDSASSIAQTADGGYIVAGVTESFAGTAGERDSWVFKLGPNGEYPDPSAVRTTSTAPLNTSISPADTTVVPQDLFATRSCAGSPGSVVLLLDVSGSMLERHDGQYPVPEEEQKITMAKKASDLFLYLLGVYGEDQANFGIASFPKHPWVGMGICEGQELSPLTTVNPTSTGMARGGVIAGLQPNGSTPMLAGISTALDMLEGGTNKTILLLTDGYHNCPSRVNPGDPVPTELTSQLNANSVRVFTVAFSRPQDLDQHWLQTLAGNTLGDFYGVTQGDPDPVIWDAATALNAAFKDILANSLELQVGIDPLAVISSGATASHAVSINKHDRRASFIVSWATSQQDRLSLRVYASDAQEVPRTSEGVSFYSTESYQILTVDKTFLEQSGKVGSRPWKIEIDPAGLGNGEEEKYQYGVIMNSVLKMRVELDKPLYSAGDTITVAAKVAKQEQPLTGLKNIHMKWTGPQEGMGNWLVANKVSAAELKKMPHRAGWERLSVRQRLARFVTDVNKVAFPSRTRQAQLPLHDDGTHGDQTANDGVYTNQITQTQKEGTYSFYIHASGQTKDGTGFTREDMVQKYLSVNATSASTPPQIGAPSTMGGRIHRVVAIAPRDALGNYVGPGYASAIRLTSTKGNMIGKLQDNLDGTYSQVLASSPDVDVKQADIRIDLSRYMPVAPPVVEEPIKEPWQRWAVILMVLLAVAVLVIIFLAVMLSRPR